MSVLLQDDDAYAGAQRFAHMMAQLKTTQPVAYEGMRYLLDILDGSAALTAGKRAAVREHMEAFQRENADRPALVELAQIWLDTLEELP